MTNKTRLWNKFNDAQKEVEAVYYDLCEDMDPQEANRHPRLIAARQKATRLYKRYQQCLTPLK